MKRFLTIAACLCALGAIALASEPTPAGAWRTIDDKTGKPRSIVRIYEENGQYFGRVEKALIPENAGKICDKCKDERKGQHVVGMVILRKMKPNGEEYSGGDILDPDNGSVYRCKLRLTDNGNKLQVRGFIGISVLGRTQTWLREQ